MIKDFIDKSKIEYYEDISLEKYNTFRLKTIAKYLIFPKDVSEFINLLKEIKKLNLKYLILGNGSNVIFKNDYYDGIVIRLDNLNNIKITDTNVVVEAGYSLIKLAMETANMSLSGLEFAAGIPGQIGASVAMNAGAYKEELANVVTKVKVINPNLEIEELENNQLDFSYRNSFFKKNKDYIIIEVTLKLNFKDKDSILELIADRRKRRVSSQPLEYPSAGSVFRNPDIAPAGKLIEDANFKNTIIGGAKVSEKHANFIINSGNAKGKDIVDLINLIKEKIKKEYDIDLILEQEIIE